MDAITVSVVVPTRGRRAAIVPAVQALLQDEESGHEVIVVDQSASDDSEHALGVAGLLSNPRLTYRRSRTTGLSRARNEGLALAHGDVIVFTDDDCVAPPGWAPEMARRFVALPDLALAPVVAPPDKQDGWIPEYQPLRDGFVTYQPATVVRQLGLGANCAVRRSALTSIGPFDVHLGAGTRNGAGEDTDFGYRALRLGLGVYTAETPAVTHYGSRAGRDASALGANYLRGLAAMCMKHVRCGDIRMLIPVLHALWGFIQEGTGHLVQRERPSGYGAAVTLLHSIGVSFRDRVDKRRRLYQGWFT